MQKQASGLVPSLPPSTDPGQFAANAEFSPVTPPATPIASVSFLTASAARKSVPLQSQAKISIPQSSITHPWNIPGLVTSHPHGSKGLVHGASGQLPSCLITPSSSTMKSAVADWNRTPVYLLQPYPNLVDPSSAMLKDQRAVSVTPTTQALKTSTPSTQCGALPRSRSDSAILSNQLLSSPSQSLHFNIQSLVYKAAPASVKIISDPASQPGKSLLRDPHVITSPPITKPSAQVVTQASKNKSISLESQKTCFASTEVKKEPSSPCVSSSLVYPQLVSVFSSPSSISDPQRLAAFTPIPGITNISPYFQSQFRPQGIGAAGFSAPGKGGSSHQTSHAIGTVAALYPHIHSSAYISSPNMLSGKQQLMMSALSMGGQRKTSYVDTATLDSAKVTLISPASVSASLQQSSSSLASAKSILGTSLPQLSQKGDAKPEEKPAGQPFTVTVQSTSRKASIESRSYDGSFSPLTPTEFGSRDPLGVSLPNAKILLQTSTSTSVTHSSTPVVTTSATSKVVISANPKPAGVPVAEAGATATNPAPCVEPLLGSLDVETCASSASEPNSTLEKSESDTASTKMKTAASPNTNATVCKQPAEDLKISAQSATLALRTAPVGSLNDDQLVIDEEAKARETTPAKARETTPASATESAGVVNRATKLITSPSKSAVDGATKSIVSPSKGAVDGAIKSIVSPSKGVVEDDKNMLSPKSTSSTSPSGPIAWPKTKKQMARQQMSSTKTQGNCDPINKLVTWIIRPRLSIKSNVFVLSAELEIY